MGFWLAGCLGDQPRMHSMGQMSWQEGIKVLGQRLKEDLNEQYKMQLLVGRTGLVKAPKIVFDPFLYVEDGQQPVVNREIGRTLEGLLGPEFQLIPLNRRNLGEAELVLTGILNLARGQGGSGANTYILECVMINKVDGVVKARVRVGLANLPLDTFALYKDSPIFLKGWHTRLALTVAQTPPNAKADPAYLEALPAKAAFQEGLELYQSKNYLDALNAFQDSLRESKQPLMSALGGVFLCTRKLGQPKQANAAFTQLLAKAIEYRRVIDFRLLFSVNSPYFIESQELVAQYAWWLKELALYAKDAGICLEIVGHSSRSGDSAYNDRLSEQRAKVVQGIMAVTYPDIMKKSSVKGMGFRDNIVGTGADDASDAIDRRVEFKIRECN
ncbi:hypothetical protein AAU61_10530 [Desulfocarbo indianensis]|nr:hypothetical protein AAU61_10530 [Desulfocarbo indianensis]